MSFVLPLPKSLYEKAKALSLEKILLEFSVKNGEYRLSLRVEPDSDADAFKTFLNEIESWVFDAYSYGEVGADNDYGDDVTYDLVKRKILQNKWHFKPASEIYGQQAFEFALQIKEGE